MINCTHKKNGGKKAFTEVAWKLLGPAAADGSKEGWVPDQDQEITSTSSKSNTVALPVTGDKKSLASVEKEKAALRDKRIKEMAAVHPMGDPGNWSEDEYQRNLKGLEEAAARESKEKANKENEARLAKQIEGAEFNLATAKTFLDNATDETREVIQKKYEEAQAAVKSAYDAAGKAYVDMDAVAGPGTGDSVSEFLKAAEAKKLSKNRVKDFFDKQEPAVAYDNKANLPALIEQLGAHLGYSIEKLNANF